MKSYLIPVLFFAACTTSSIKYQYTPSLSRPESKAKAVKIAIADFTDTRSYERPNHKRASSFFLSTPKRFLLIPYRKFYGLRHRGKKFPPIARVLRDLSFRELEYAGADVLRLDTLKTNPSIEELLSLAKNAKADYLLTGRISLFFVKRTRGISVLSKNRSEKLKNLFEVEIRLSLQRVSDGESIWSFKLYEDIDERTKNIRPAVKILFGEILPSLLVKGSGFTLDQIEMNLEDIAQEKDQR